MSYRIRQMSEENARLAFEWGKQAGWNPGLHDWRVMRDIDPAGCFAGFLDGVMISSITAVHYRRKYGFLAVYIVSPEYRGQGYGVAIWRHGLNYLNNEIGVECIGLDGVLANEPLYNKWGFNSYYKTWRYKSVNNRAYIRKCPEINEPHFPDVSSYDLKVFQVDRTSFLHDFIFKTEAKTAVHYVAGKLAGFAVARPCYEGYKIGPLFADDIEAAGMLTESLLADLPGQTIFIEVPETNRHAIQLVSSLDMIPEIPTFRMYTGNKYHLDTSYAYGITSRTTG